MARIADGDAAQSGTGTVAQERMSRLSRPIEHRREYIFFNKNLLCVEARRPAGLEYMEYAYHHPKLIVKP
jgi:hypothetical protein